MSWLFCFLLGHPKPEELVFAPAVHGVSFRCPRCGRTWTVGG